MSKAMRPLLKWAGGKRWLVPILQDIWEPHRERRLVEPFVGGLSVALGLTPKQALLNDANIHLINFYQQVKKGLTCSYAFKNERNFYYDVRDQFNDLIRNKRHQTEDAAQFFYFLMRTGYNGLCRFNSKGEFNVPFGSHKTIKYRKDFLEYQPSFQHFEFQKKDFEKIKLNQDDFLYADPPYDVEFTQYYSTGFDWDDQLRLAAWLSTHRGPVVVSNQATKRILSLYKELKFEVFVLEAPRSIACTGNREKALEMLAIKEMNASRMKKIKSIIKNQG